MEKFYSPLLYGATSQTILIILPLYKSSLFVAVKKKRGPKLTALLIPA